MTEQKHQCCEMVHHRAGWSSVRCGRGGAYEFEGKHYCGTHHPPAVKARNAERNERIYKQMAEDEQQMKLKRLIRERDAYRAQCFDRLVNALGLIADTDPIDAALDPQRAIRVAKEALDSIAPLPQQDKVPA